MTVRVRVTAVAVLVTAVALAVGGWGLLRSIESTQLGRIAAATEEQVDVVAAQLAAGVSADRVHLATDSDMVATGVVQVIETATGDVLTASPPTAAEAVPLVVSSDDDVTEGHPLAGAIYATDVVGGTRVEGLPPGVVGDFVAPFELRYQTVDTPRGEVTVAAASPLAEVTRSLDAVRRALRLGLPLVVVLVGGVAWFVTGRALRPVEAMRAEAESITHSTLHRRVPEPASSDEVGRLARTMNAMLDRLQGAAELQQRFVADASHELRTPVAALRVELEVALRSGGEAALRRAVEGALVEEQRLEALLADLLLLASVEDEPSAAGHGAVDLAALVAVEAARPRRVPVSVTGSGTVRGSARQLERVVTNLLDNAARHARAAVAVTVDGGRLTVDDDGPGIPAADRARVLERFTRLDESRARDDGGAGLGLSIVVAVAAAHGGTVHVDDAADLGGARVVVTLPPG